jgi:hypothetical protein
MDNLSYELETFKRNARANLDAISKWEESRDDGDLKLVAAELAITYITMRPTLEFLKKHLTENDILADPTQ